MDTKDLNVDYLCSPPNKYDKRGANRVLEHWMKTSSPLWSYWGKLFQNAEGLRGYTLPKTRCTPVSIPLKFNYGLPWDETDSMCKSIYSEEVVKLTVQIAEPTVMTIEKDVSATFTDQLGTIGNGQYFN